jgi:UDP-glucose 4-epimerase
VIHLAGTLHVTSSTHQAATDYESLNVAGTAALARDAVARGVRRVVFFSTISVYGDTHGSTASESTPVMPITPYARSKVAAEIALEEQCRGTSCIATVLRVAAVYGPRVKGNYLTMFDRLAQGRSLPVLPGSNRRSLVFVDDAARAALLVADHPRAAGGTYNVTDGQVYSVAEIVTAMCVALGRSVPRVGIPSWAAAALVNASRPILRGALVNVAALVDKYVEDVAIDGSALRNELGFQPSVDLLEGWRRTAREARISR